MYGAQITYDCIFSLSYLFFIHRQYTTSGKTTVIALCGFLPSDRMSTDAEISRLVKTVTNLWNVIVITSPI